MMKTYYCPGAGKIHGMHLTLSDRFHMWQKRRQRRKELMWP